MKHVVQLDNVSKQFGSLAVIEQFSATLAVGDIVSLVGPSGCGKSTLLRLIAGVEEVSDGHIHCHIPPEKIGFVFQDVRLLPWRTALQNITFVLRDRISHKAERQERAQQALHRVGLTGFADYLPQQLSGGMKKRVAIARALAIEADLILLDEPFSDLDLPLRLLLIQEVQELLKGGGKTAVYVTHDIREALTLSDRVYVLSARPARIKETVHLNNLPHRGQVNGVHSPELLAIETRIIAALQEGIQSLATS
ncbi:MAG: ABC transporter ATP-binding protein [Chloroflexi bacterium]|nr:MAG: ABC transporter ATP-binding protein [Chloroflexota bacterium]PIE79617.1 MAG: ABC transporter ATP-binding protein [Chloroflexota bacterium]